CRTVAQSLGESIGEQELQQRRRLVQPRPVMSAGIGALSAQALEQDDLRFATEFTVAASKLLRVGVGRPQRILIAVYVQNLDPGRRERCKVVDRVELAGASVEFPE